MNATQLLTVVFTVVTGLTVLMSGCRPAAEAVPAAGREMGEPKSDDSDEPVGAVPDNWQVFGDDTYGFQLRYPENWTYEEAELLPANERPDAEKALQRMLFFQPEGWDGVAPPLHIQFTQGTEEEFGRLLAPATSAERIEKDGLVIVRDVEDFGGLQLIRYLLQSPLDETVRMVALDYISGFPERAEGHEAVVETLEQIVSTMEFVE